VKQPAGEARADKPISKVTETTPPAVSRNQENKKKAAKEAKG